MNKLPEMHDDFFTEAFEERPGVRERAQRSVHNGFVVYSKLRIATDVEIETPQVSSEHSENIVKTIIIVECPVVASCKKDEYTVTLMFDQLNKQFLRAPWSRCTCFGGSFFCSHMAAVLCYLKVLQYGGDKHKLDHQSIVDLMPPEIDLLYKMPIAQAFVFGNDEGTLRSAESKRAFLSHMSKSEHQGNSKVTADSLKPLKRNIVSVEEDGDAVNNNNNTEKRPNDTDGVLSLDEDGRIENISCDGSDSAESDIAEGDTSSIDETSEQESVESDCEENDAGLAMANDIFNFVEVVEDFDEELEKENMSDLREILESSKAGLREEHLLMYQMEKYVDCCLSAMKVGGGEASSGRLLQIDAIERFNKWIFDERLPNSCTSKKREQLRTHQALFDAYEARELEPDMIYFYLHFHLQQRLEMIDAIDTGNLVYFDKIPNHLANLPPGWLVLADRGFAFDATKYPNLNAHITPAFNKNKSQFDQEVLEEMWKTCMLRWSSETHISFITNQEPLQDVVPYSYFSIMQDCIDWACGLANFNQPLQPPDSYKKQFPHLFEEL